MNAHGILIFIIVITIRCDEDLNIRIGLPEYICDKDGGVRDVSNDLTTIRLLGKTTPNITYQFEVNFHTIAKKCRNPQRCTLLTWKAVRELDRHLKNYPLTKLQNGLIEINNTMLDPGIKYLINVTMMDKGRVIQEKQLTLDYVDDAVRQKIKKPMASLLLLGPDTSYAYTTYVINAELNMCSNISYYFKWELDSAENTTVFPSKSFELVIPPDTLQGSQTYTLICSLIGIPNDEIITKNQQTLNVLSKGLLLRLPIKRFTARTNQEVRLNPYIRDLDNIDGEIRVSWGCRDLSNDMECEYDNDMISTFTTPGLYKLTLEISKSDFSESDSCTVEIKDDGPIVEIDEIEFPIDLNKGIEIRTKAYELRSSCSLQWTSPEEEGYESLDLTTVPGNVGDVTNVTMKEDLFLSELEEFSNSTIDKQYDLIISPPMKTWSGLKGNVKYLFRLVITCSPMDYEELNGTEIITLTDVVIETNAPPKTPELEVTPLEGNAFETTFRFKTQKVNENDGPYLYKFGYILGEKNVVLWNLGEVTNCEGTLPFMEGGLQTFMKVCDSFGSCGRVLGPLIKMRLPEKMDQEMVLQRFTSKLLGGDYTKAFTEAVAILHTYNSTRDVIGQKISDEIGKFLKMDNNDDMKRGAEDLMQNINEFNSELQLPETTLNQVLELRNKISEGSDRFIQRNLLSLRSKRASSLTLHDVKNYLDISELIITTSNDSDKVNFEKENLRKQLINYMEKLCTHMKKTQLSLELKTVIFSVEKLKKNSLNTFISVPFEGNLWQTFGRVKIGNRVKDSKDKCVGKAIFKDYFEKVGITYFVDILNTDYVADSGDVHIYLPKNRTLEGTPKCLVYYNNEWRSDCKVTQNIANYVKCTCKYLGYYYLEYSQVASSSVLPTTTLKPTESILTTIAAVTDGIISNETMARLSEETSQGNYDTISYVVIGVSVIGIIILAITVRKIFQDEDDNEEDTFDFPKYAQLHNEEFLNDAHI